MWNGSVYGACSRLVVVIGMNLLIWTLTPHFYSDNVNKVDIKTLKICTNEMISS